MPSRAKVKRCAESLQRHFPSVAGHYCFRNQKTFSVQRGPARLASGASHPGCGSQRLLRSRLHPAGRCPNNFFLFPPLAAVEIVAPFGRGVTAGDGEGEPAKEKASATTIRRLSEIQKRLLQMLLLYTILRHAKGTSSRNIILRPSGHPDARAVCVSMRRTAAAMQSTGCR